MSAAAQPVERREEKRYKAKQGAFAVLRRPWPDSTILGRMVDISHCGLSFCYVAGEEPLPAFCDLEILWNDCGFRLTNIPGKTVSDFETPADGRFHSLQMRRSSMQFGNLTRSQKSQIEHFIRNYTLDLIPPTIPPAVA